MPAVNRYVRPDEKEAKKKKKSKRPSWLGKVSGFKMKLGDDVALRYVPYVIFVTFLGLIYIANNHGAEKLAGKITKLEREVKQLQMEYGTLKYEFMNKHNKAQIESKMRKVGLYPNDKPIIKVVVNE